MCEIHRVASVENPTNLPGFLVALRGHVNGPWPGLPEETVLVMERLEELGVVMLCRHGAEETWGDWERLDITDGDEVVFDPARTQFKFDKKAA